MSDDLRMVEPQRPRGLRALVRSQAPAIAEAGGVALMSTGGWLAWEPLGLFMAGIYVVMLADRRRPQNGGRR